MILGVFSSAESKMLSNTYSFLRYQIGKTQENIGQTYLE
jgi:hypothetical protein